MTFIIHQSGISLWRTCKRKYYFAVDQQLRQKRPARQPTFGSIMHRCLELEASGGDPLAYIAELESAPLGKVFKEEEALYGQLMADCRYVWEGYLDYWGSRKIELLKPPKTKQRAEHKFSVQVAKGVTLEGKCDGFTRYKPKVTALLEHKTHKTFPTPDHRWRNLQAAIYIRAMQILGWFDLDGTYWNYIRNKEPTRPQLKMDGTLSERDIDTLPQVIIDAAAPLTKPRDYSQFIASIRAKMGSWYQREFTPIKRPVVRLLWKEFLDTAQEIRYATEDKELAGAPRNIGLHCDWCPYESLCRAELTGSDVDFVKERQYTVSDDPIWDDL